MALESLGLLGGVMPVAWTMCPQRDDLSHSGDDLLAGQIQTPLIGGQPKALVFDDLGLELIFLSPPSLIAPSTYVPPPFSVDLARTCSDWHKSLLIKTVKPIKALITF